MKTHVNDPDFDFEQIQAPAVRKPTSELKLPLPFAIMSTVRALNLCRARMKSHILEADHFKNVTTYASTHTILSLLSFPFPARKTLVKRARPACIDIAGGLFTRRQTTNQTTEKINEINPAIRTGSPYAAFMTILQTACTYIIINYL